jgi:hypothetical protein
MLWFRRPNNHCRRVVNGRWLGARGRGKAVCARGT